jgi:hypothetical protein
MARDYKTEITTRTGFAVARMGTTAAATCPCLGKSTIFYSNNSMTESVMHRTVGCDPAKRRAAATGA